MARTRDAARGHRGVVPALSLLFALAACSGTEPALSPYAPLPEPLTNNAVAALDDEDGARLYSFLGLGPGKTHKDMPRAAYEYDIGRDRWRALPPPPLPQGRLAAASVALRDRIWLIGGYSVAADGHEVSTPELLSFDPRSELWQRHADMPVPVDDSVALPYADRYIYLVSGWHDDGNVAAVQVYDSENDIWFAASDFPGIPVFGHAGGIVEGRILVIDGVAVLGSEDGKRRFGLVSQAWVGAIDPDAPSVIDWQRVPHHGGPPLYRAAATGSAATGLVLFAGGATRAYNYDGIGYDGLPAEPSARVFGYDPANDVWMRFPDKAIASMDHRGLLEAAGAFWTVGGMGMGRTVLPWLDRFEIRE